MLRKKIRKDRRLEIRLSYEEFKKINYLVKRLGFDNRSQLLIHLVNSAYMDKSVCPFCAGEVIEMTEQNGLEEGWFICSQCGYDFDLVDDKEVDLKKENERLVDEIIKLMKENAKNSIEKDELVKLLKFVVDRLSAYEDIGLLPEAITDIIYT